MVIDDVLLKDSNTNERSTCLKSRPPPTLHLGSAHSTTTIIEWIIDQRLKTKHLLGSPCLIIIMCYADLPRCTLNILQKKSSAAPKTCPWHPQAPQKVFRLPPNNPQTSPGNTKGVQTAPTKSRSTFQKLPEGLKPFKQLGTYITRHMTDRFAIQTSTR